MKEERKCPDCESNKQIVEEDELICEDCGYVFENSYSPENERKSEEYNERPYGISQARLEAARHAKEMSTMMDGNKEDWEKTNPEFYRMKVLNERFILSEDTKFLESVSDRLEDYKKNLSAPVYDRAVECLLDVKKRNLLKGRSIETVFAACAYGASIELFGNKTSLCDIVKIEYLSAKCLKKTYRFLFKEDIFIKPKTPKKDYVSAFCERLNLEKNDERNVRKIIIKAKENGLIEGYDIRGPIGAAIYMVSDKTQKEIAEIVGVTDVTIRNRHKKLLKLDK